MRKSTDGSADREGGRIAWYGMAWHGIVWKARWRGTRGKRGNGWEVQNVYMYIYRCVGVNFITLLVLDGG